MKKTKSRGVVLGVFAGLFLGVLLCAAVYDLAQERVCPQRLCVGESEITPISDRTFFPVAHEALQKAKRSIHIAAFELKYYDSYAGSLENRIIDDLVAAHERGVDVRIVIDEYADKVPGNNAYEYLRSKGVGIKYDSNKTTTHSKLVVIDGRIVILGSTNFSYYALEKNNEAGVKIVSEKVARYFEDYFGKLWAAS